MSNPERRTNERADAGGRAMHDIGGLDFGPIDRHEHDLKLWEKRTDAMLMLLTGPKKGAFKIDALRRTIEDYSQQDYDTIGYYDKWIKAVRNLVVEQEILTREEVDRRVAELAKANAKAGRKVSKQKVSW